MIYFLLGIYIIHTYIRGLKDWVMKIYRTLTPKCQSYTAKYWHTLHGAGTEPLDVGITRLKNGKEAENQTDIFVPLLAELYNFELF